MRTKQPTQGSLELSSFDARAFAVLRAGRPLSKKEIGQVSDLYRPIVQSMADVASEPQECNRVFEAWIDEFSEDEADDLIEQIAKVDPDAPPPEGDHWGPLRLGELPEVFDFPLDVLPDSAAQLVVEASGAVGCDPGLVAGPVLATAAGQIGRSASLLLGSNRFASACLFQANIGLPGDGKSPAQSYATDPIRVLERELATLFKGEKERYLDALEEATAAKKNGITRDRLAPPIPRRACLDDVTVEAMFRVLADNERGLLMVRDELSALILGLGQYKSGANSDRPNLLKTWSGASVTIDRVLNEFREPIRIPFPTLSITGNLPPGMLVKMVNPDGDDGFIDRWLFCFPDSRPKLKSAQRRPVRTETIQRWADTVRRLWNRPMDVEGGDAHPHVIYFVNAAKAEYDRLYDAHVDEVNAPDFADTLRGPWSKLEEYAGRFCLILTLLNHADDPTADTTRLPMVGVREVRDAWRLIDYFKSHHRRVRAFFNGKGLGGSPDGVRFILRWLRNHPDVAVFPEGELTRDIPAFRKDRATMEDGLLWLEQRRAIRRRPEPARPKGTRGRKAAPQWEVHPSLRDSENSDNTEKTRCIPSEEDRKVHSTNCPNSPNSERGDDQEGDHDGRPSF